MMRSWERHQSRPSSSLSPFQFPRHVSSFRKARYTHSLPRTSSVRLVWWQPFPGDRGQRSWEDTAPLRIHTLPRSPGQGEPYRDDGETPGSQDEDSQTTAVFEFSTQRGFHAPPITPTLFAGSVAAAPSLPPGSSMKVPHVCTPAPGSTP